MAEMVKGIVEIRISEEEQECLARWVKEECLSDHDQYHGQVLAERISRDFLGSIGYWNRKAEERGW